MAVNVINDRRRTPTYDPVLFFGRADEISEILTHLRKDLSVSIIGTPQVGKTWLLQRICAIGQQEVDASFVFVDLQMIRTPAEFYEFVLRQLGDHGKTLDAFRRLVRSRRVVLCIDGIGEQTRALLPGYKMDLLGPLHALRQAGDLLMVTASREPLTHYFGPDSPLRLSRMIEIGPLEVESAKKLIFALLGSAGVSFEIFVVEDILVLAGCDPSRIKLACDCFRDFIDGLVDDWKSQYARAIGNEAFRVKLGPPQFLPAGRRLSRLVTVDGTGYHLVGFNLVIFEQLWQDPIFKERLPEEERSGAVANLAIALANVARGVIEQKTKDLMRTLWRREKRTGIKRFFNLLAEREWRDNDWEGYRDHLSHMLKVYLLGLCLYKNSRLIRDQLKASANNDEDACLRRWLFASSFHDIGYIFELLKPTEAKRNLGFVQDYLDDFLYYHDQDLQDDLENAECKTGSLSQSWVEIFLHEAGLVPVRLTREADLKKAWGDPGRDLLKCLDELCEATGIGHGGIEVYHDTCLSQDPPMRNGRSSFYDHGISGALLLLHIGHAQRALFQSLKKMLDYQPMPQSVATHLEVLTQITNWAGNLDEYISDLEQAAAAIALHNIYVNAWDPKASPGGLDLPNFCIKFRKYPLAFLLVLVDILQDWDRPGFFPARDGKKPGLEAQDIDGYWWDETLCLHYPNDPDKAVETLAALKKALFAPDISKLLVIDEVRTGSAGEAV